MQEPTTICLLNDSFPPQYDGVAMAVTNYAGELYSAGHRPLVVTPSNPQAEDDSYPYPVLRYPSVAFRRLEGYMAGIPFSPEIAGRVSEERPALYHSHCPIMSTILARELRQVADAPIVFTYHTKFDIDIANLTQKKHLQDMCKHALAENIAACDEVWTVSTGAGENLRSLGYEGDYIIMPNGVDMPRGRVSEQKIKEATAGYDLPEGVPVYLFVGRMMWYKGVRIILDALASLKHRGRDFRMVFIGSGNDRAEMEGYAVRCGLGDRCIFTGPIMDRETIRAWYARANLFLFPSTFDTNGLVVREAAASGLAAVLVAGSCAAEGVMDCRNGFLIEENPDSLSRCLEELYTRPELVKAVGEAAQRELYISWQEAVAVAMDRYQVIIDKYKSGGYPRHKKPIEGWLKANGELMDTLSALSTLRRSLHDSF